jgi:TonB family protein
MTFDSLRNSLQILLLLLFFAFISSRSNAATTIVDLDDLAARISAQISSAGIKSVAVANFVGADGKNLELGWYLADKLSDGLIIEEVQSRALNNPALDAKDRSKVQQSDVLLTPSTSPDTLKQVVAASGAEALIVGTIAISSDKYIVTVTALRVSDGSTIATATQSLPHSRVLDVLTPAGANAAPINAVRAGVSGVGVPACAYCPAPAYLGASRLTQPATVELMVTISAAGTAEKISVIKSPGYTLTERAVETVSEWKFRPAPGKDGTPVPVAVPIDVTFKASRT